MKDPTRIKQNTKFGDGIIDAGKGGGKIVNPCLPGAHDDRLYDTHTKSGKLSGNTLPGANDTRLYTGKGSK